MPAIGRCILLRPSDIKKAKSEIDAAKARSHDFGEAFFKYEVGKRIVAYSNSVVEMNAKDLLADSVFDDVQKSLATACSGLSALTTLTADAVVPHRHVSNLAAKIFDAFRMWSAARCLAG